MKLKRLTTEYFKARLAQANLITKTDLDIELKKVSVRVTSNKSKPLLVENELKNKKHLIQAILNVKVVLKKMVHKII